MPVLTETAESLISVNLGEICSARQPAETLVAFGLGSCVAACLWEPAVKLAVMAHVVLPHHGGRAGSQPGKFADLALPHMLDLVRQHGGRRDRLVFRMAGGASVLALPGASAALQVGDRNIEAIRDMAAQLGLRVHASDVGGTRGRTVRMSGATGEVFVRTLGSGERQI